MPASWTLISLTELITHLCLTDEEVDLGSAIDRMAERLDAEISAICSKTSVGHSNGFGRGAVPEELLQTLAGNNAKSAQFDDLGRLHITRSILEGTDDTLVFGRSGDEFSPDEQAYVRSVGRVVGLWLRMRSSLIAERTARRDLQERQGLLDRLFQIQRAISHRQPTNEILDAVTSGVLEVLGKGRVNLHLVDTENPGDQTIISSSGYTSSQLKDLRVRGIAEGATKECLRQGRLVIQSPSQDGEIDETLGEATAVMSTPVHVQGKVLGCLTVAFPTCIQPFSDREQQVLLAFAEHASLALQDAQATEAMSEALERERHRSAHDALTRLPNRAAIQKYLDDRLIGDSASLTALFVDLDHFKLANDTLGHRYGDQVLQAVAERIRVAIRPDDFVGRLSGDEFVVVCSSVNQVQALDLARRIQNAICEPIVEQDNDQVITASVGIATAVAGDSASELIANADLAMYRAKQSGRARIEVFDHEFRNDMEQKLMMQGELRRALANGDLIAHLQPVVTLPERSIISYEALVRWVHPVRGNIAPGEFIGLAEEAGLVAEIDKFMIDESLRLVAKYKLNRHIAVNLSGRTFADPTLVDWIAGRLNFHQVDPSLLAVEMTETVLMDYVATASDHLKAMRKLGISVLIDDFGTGYSSLSYLQTFDVDGVKIDRSFTNRLESDPKADAIVAGVLHMAEALGLYVVVEGVETETEVNCVLGLRDRSAAVELQAQGFLFGRPEKYVHWLEPAEHKNNALLAREAKRQSGLSV